jgi:hypothetical protein
LLNRNEGLQFGQYEIQFEGMRLLYLIIIIQAHYKIHKVRQFHEI